MSYWHKGTTGLEQALTLHPTVLLKKSHGFGGRGCWGGEEIVGRWRETERHLFWTRAHDLVSALLDGVFEGGGASVAMLFSALTTGLEQVPTLDPTVLLNKSMLWWTRLGERECHHISFPPLLLYHLSTVSSTILDREVRLRLQPSHSLSDFPKQLPLEVSIHPSPSNPLPHVRLLQH